MAAELLLPSSAAAVSQLSLLLGAKGTSSWARRVRAGTPKRDIRASNSAACQVAMRGRSLAYSLFPIIGALSFGAGSRPSWTTQLFAILLCTCVLEVALSLSASSRMDAGQPSATPGRGDGGRLAGQTLCGKGKAGLIKSSIADGLRNGLASGMASATCKVSPRPPRHVRTGACTPAAPALAHQACVHPLGTGGVGARCTPNILDASTRARADAVTPVRCH